eukprot:jgi/Botrbrau1/13931/Bobra.136_2s0016.2
MSYQGAELTQTSFRWDNQAGPMQTFHRVFGEDSYFQALQDLSEHMEHGMEPAAVCGKNIKPHEVEVTLEDILSGTRKSVEYTRHIARDNGEVEQLPATITLDIPPGTSEGSSFHAAGMGDVIRVGANPEPAWFRVSARPHPRFQREGADLITTSTIPLVQALTGGCLQVETLSGRVLSVPIAQVVPEGHTITLPGEGLPCNGGKGTMRVRLHIQFPEQLTGQQKALIRAALHFPSKPQTNHSQAATGFLENFHHPALGWSAVFPKSSGP